MASPFSPQELAYLKAHQNDSRVHEIHWVYSVPIAAGVISTSTRIWAKYYGRNGIALDDYLIAVATICLIGTCASGLAYGPPNGMGRHIIVVTEYGQRMVRQGDYVFSHFYDFSLVFVKLAILAFYWRIFVQPVFRAVVCATAAFVVCWGIGITVTLLLACRPLRAYWDVAVPGHCLKIVMFTYFTNISNLVTDVWIFLMPIPMIWVLQLQTKRKMMLILIFCIGLAVCVISALRLTIILGRANPDFTWYYVPSGAYSVFEPLGGILCTNLPIIWHTLRKMRAKHRGQQTSGTRDSKNVNSIFSAGSRRVASALCISSKNRTQNDSGAATTQEAAEMGRHLNGEGHWQRIEDVESQKPDPRIWTTVERGDIDCDPSSPDLPVKDGMKKTTWNIRK